MRQPWVSRLIWCSGIAVLVVLLAVIGLRDNKGGDSRPPSALDRERDVLNPLTSPPRSETYNRLTIWWDAVPADVKAKGHDTGSKSNIRPQDYAGPSSCSKCHERNYRGWSNHPHRWMNALADEGSVRGDFSGASVSYRGGTATFFREAGGYRMRLEREVTRVYEVNQTIGSRFYQYYVGKQLEGPEPGWHRYYNVDHVLPFGYWLAKREWVPVVRIQNERPDDVRPDPFSARRDGQEYTDLVPYTDCNDCHTTFALGDMLVRNPYMLGRYPPARLHFFESAYLRDAHPELTRGWQQAADASDSQRFAVDQQMALFEAPRHAITLGVSCEACHLGCKQHAEGKQKKPDFLPCSPHLFTSRVDQEIEFGRSHGNLNWVCGRCHTAKRVQFAAGMAVWNSTEFDDAMKGSCYSQLTCVRCHNPHQATGPKWTRTAAQDDAVCLTCHQQFSAPQARTAHTHHAAESSGSHCMNCHMPRINEGMQDVVRTHMIFSPTQPDMIHANHPNACNLCHVKEPVDWTVRHLQDWYGAHFDEAEISFNYSSRDEPVGLGWLHHTHPSVRLVGADALTKADARWALPELIDALDDPYLLVRQFTALGLERMLGIDLRDYGYRHYMTQQERRPALERLRKEFLKAEDR